MELSNVSVLDTRRKILLNTPHIDTSVGDLVTFNTDLSAPLKSCKVSFLPVQEGEGDPSPDNVRNIVGWNGVNIYKAGQNLIPNDIPAQFYRVYPIASQGAFVESGAAFSTFIIPVPKGKICLARTTRSLISYGALCDELPAVGANAFNVVTMTNRDSHIFDNSEGHKYFAITTGRSVEVNSNWDSFLDTEPRLTLSDTAQPYTAPTNISTHSVDWTDSVGTIYGGYVDLVSGELVEEWHSITFDGDNIKVNRDYIKSGDTDYIKAYWVYFSPVGISDIHCKCNTLKITYTHNKSYIPQTPCLFLSGNGNTFGGLILGKKEDYPELAEGTAQDRIDAINNWFRENPTQVIYKLADPIHYQLTPQQLSTLKGTNNVYSNTNGQTEIKYWKH